MELSQFSLDDWITIILIIAQAGVVYYRLKRVEQRTDKLNDLIIEFAVHKTSLKHHRHEFEKQSIRLDHTIQKLDDRLSGIESHAYKALVKYGQVRREP